MVIFQFFHIACLADSRDEAQVEELLARAQSFMGSVPDTAYIWASDALLIAESSGYTLGAAQAKELIGEVFYHQGAFLQALNYHLQASDLYERDQRLAVTSQMPQPNWA
ncbi:MAG: hypothetical protein HC842_07305, partial [Cytophagales bacterium]|nr:hypothetical protein [Cytophagales bacterium]